MSLAPASLVLPATRSAGSLADSRAKELPPLVDTSTALWILGLIVLTIVLTGPGLWSENWGYGFLDKLFGRGGKQVGPEVKKRGEGDGPSEGPAA
jgi:hypothetical protein